MESSKYYLSSVENFLKNSMPYINSSAQENRMDRKQAQ
jgi:hypothetical protein